MSWHNFENGEPYSLTQISETYNKYIDSDKVKAKEEKRELLQQIRDRRQAVLKYNPKGLAWGNSPLNPKSWDATDG